MSDIYLITKDGVNGAVIDEAVAPTKAAQHKLLTAFSSVIKDTFPKELEKPGGELKKVKNRKLLFLFSFYSPSSTFLYVWWRHPPVPLGSTALRAQR